MKTTTPLFLALAIMAMVLPSCKRNNSSDPKPETPLDPGAGDQENITRVQLYFTDSVNTAHTFSVKHSDPDGDGRGLPPMIDSLKLDTNKVYFVKLGIYDDTKNPVDTVTNEILKEANYHRFHYTFTAATGSTARMLTTILDHDTRVPAQPLGLSFKVKTGSGTGKGVFNINLRHFSNGLEKNDDPAGGEQDVLVDFPSRIE